MDESIVFKKNELSIPKTIIRPLGLKSEYKVKSIPRKNIIENLPLPDIKSICDFLKV